MATVVVSAFTPGSGQTLKRSQPVSFNVTSDGALPSIIVTAEFGGSGIEEVVWDGAAFTANYASLSSRAAIPPSGGYSGFTFALLRVSGWPGAPVFRTYTTGSGATLSNNVPPAVAAAGSAGVVAVGAREDHTHAHGNQTGSTIAGTYHAAADATKYGFLSPTHFTLLAAIAAAGTAADILLRTGTVAMTAPFNFGGQRGINAADPVAATDVSTMGWVQTQIAGLQFRVRANAATTAALAAYTPTATTLTANVNGAFPTTDGVAAVLNNRYLVKDETAGNAPYNGLYALTQVGDGSHPWILTRTTDADTAAELPVGLQVYVQAGTANGKKTFTLTTTGAITVGVTALAFESLAATSTGAPAGTILKPARVVTVAALPACTYSGTGNGTLTGSVNGAVPSATTDGVALGVGDDVVVANEASLTNCGIYTVTQVGSGAAPFIYTRRSDVAHGAAIPWGAEIRLTDGAGNRGKVYVDGIVGTTGTVGTNSFKLALPDVRNPLFGPLDCNAQNLTNVGDVTTFAPTATGGSPTKNSQTLTLSGAFWTGAASTPNTATVQHKPVSSGAATADAATDFTIGGYRAIRFFQCATQISSSVIVGRGALNAIALGSSEGFANFFESYGDFAMGFTSAAAGVGYAGTNGYTFTQAFKVFTDGSFRIGTSSTGPSLGAGALRVDGYAAFGSTVTLDNAVNLAWKDSGGSTRTLLSFDASNILQFGHASYRTKHLGGEINAITRPGAYPYTALDTDRVILLDGTVGSRQVNLINAPTDGTTQRFLLRGTFSVTLARQGSDVIDSWAGMGATTVSLGNTTSTVWEAVYNATNAIWSISY